MVFIAEVANKSNLGQKCPGRTKTLPLVTWPKMTKTKQKFHHWYPGPKITNTNQNFHHWYPWPKMTKKKQSFHHWYPWVPRRFGCKGPAIFGKDRSPNIGDWGTVKGCVGFGAKSNKQGRGKRAIYEKRLKHRKS